MWQCKGCKTPNNAQDNGTKCKKCSQDRRDLTPSPEKKNRVSFDRFKQKPSVKVGKPGDKKKSQKINSPEKKMSQETPNFKFNNKNEVSDMNSPLATIISPGVSRNKARPSRSKVFKNKSSSEEDQIDFSKFAKQTDAYKAEKDGDLAVVLTSKSRSKGKARPSRSTVF